MGQIGSDITFDELRRQFCDAEKEIAALREKVAAGEARLREELDWHAKADRELNDRRVAAGCRAVDAEDERDTARARVTALEGELFHVAYARHLECEHESNDLAGCDESKLCSRAAQALAGQGGKG